jgi:hypothetical protein
VAISANAVDAFAFPLLKPIGAGTIITIQTDQTTPIASKGSVVGKGGGLSTSAETV